MKRKQTTKTTPRQKRTTKTPPRKKGRDAKVVRALVRLAERKGTSVEGVSGNSKSNIKALKNAKIRKADLVEANIREASRIERASTEALRKRVWALGGLWNGQYSPEREAEIKQDAEAAVGSAAVSNNEGGRHRRTSKQDRKKGIIDLLTQHNSLTGPAIREKLALSSIASVMKQLEDDGVVEEQKTSSSMKEWSLKGKRKGFQRPKRKSVE